MAAVHPTPRSIRVGAATLLVPLQRHPTTLAILIGLLHSLVGLLRGIRRWMSVLGVQPNEPVHCANLSKRGSPLQWQNERDTIG